jgi:ElaB/YqjD/DUF883 family membrane-anchored ribosome-binding protein
MADALQSATGGLQRIGHAADEHGVWHSEFVDDAGRKYRAQADEHGNRAGHFVDDAGRIFSGFIDETGHRIDQFRDEAGNLIAETSGWASHAWHDMRDAIGRNAQGVAQAAMSMGSNVQSQAAQLTSSATSLLRDQPLIGGALAFAAGAALGAVLPHTEQEDRAVGDIADDVKREAAKTAGKLYDQGKEQAAELYEEASEKVGEVYEDAKAKLADGLAPRGNGGATSTNPRDSRM